MTARHDLLLPIGWRPGRNVRVQVLIRDGQVNPDGVWRVIDRSPDGWWLQPADSEARGWAVDHPGDILQGCISVAGHRLVPAEVQLQLDAP